jgi:AcrR family transcriptional regulator
VSAPVSEPRSRLQVDERRAQLLSLGMELFSSHSFDELSVDDISRAAGISKGLIYHYFESKRGFYVACIRASAEQLRARTDLAAADNPLDQLRAGLDAYLGYVEVHAHAYVTLFRGGIGFDPEVGQIVEETRQHFVQRMLEKLDPGAAKLPRVRNALRGYVGFVEAAAMDWADHHDVDRDRLLELLVTMAEQTVRSVGAAPE